LIVAIAAPFITHKIQVQRVKRLKEKFFKQNHGLLLKQLISQNTDIGALPKDPQRQGLLQAIPSPIQTTTRRKD